MLLGNRVAPKEDAPISSAEAVYSCTLILPGQLPGGPLEQAYMGPFRVLARSDKVFRIQMGERIKTVTAERLKPHTGAEPVPGQPPRRSRLPETGGGG